MKQLGGEERGQRWRHPRAIVLAAGLAATVSLGGAGDAGTPNGSPCGPSASSPTGLMMQSERAEFTYLRGTDTVRYVHRVEFRNRGPNRRLGLFLDLVDASTGDERSGPPSVVVQVDDRPVPVHCDTIGDLFRFHWSFAPSRTRFTVETRTAFTWLMDACSAPDYHLEWRPADSSAFDVSAATREVVFRFEPAVSLMAVGTWTEGALFERGALRWRWQGSSPSAFDVWIDSEFADEHTDLFPGPCAPDHGLENSYYEIFSRSCEKSEFDAMEPADSLTADMRAWVGYTRGNTRSAINSLRARHRLAPLDTTSTGEPPLAQQGLADSTLAGLNPVERWNLRYAVGLMWALDVTQPPSAIVARVNRVEPPR